MSSPAPTPTSVAGLGRRRNWRRNLLWFGAAAAVVVITLALVVRAIVPYAVIVPGRIERTTKYAGRVPADLGLRGERFDVEVEPGLWLHGYLLHALTGGNPRGTGVLLHGHGSCKESTFPLAKLLAEHGYQSLAYDSRGQGESGGSYCTFGYYEHTDCSRYVDAAEKRFGPLGPVALQGQSFGGAVALQTLAADHRFRCGVVECTFASLRGVVQSDARRWSHLPFEAPVDDALRRAGEIAHFPAQSISPARAAEDITCPVLLLHGTDDHRIPVTDGEEIFRHLKAPGCEWYPVPGAGHGGIWHTAGHAYERRVLDFLDRYELP